MQCNCTNSLSAAVYSDHFSCYARLRFKCVGRDRLSKWSINEAKSENVNYVEEFNKWLHQICGPLSSFRTVGMIAEHSTCGVQKVSVYVTTMSNNNSPSLPLDTKKHSDQIWSYSSRHNHFYFYIKLTRRHGKAKWFFVFAIVFFCNPVIAYWFWYRKQVPLQCFPFQYSCPLFT